MQFVIFLFKFSFDFHEQGQLCNTVATVALIDTSIQSDL